jgi:hypothetical protein
VPSPTPVSEPPPRPCNQAYQLAVDSPGNVCVRSDDDAVLDPQTGSETAPSHKASEPEPASHAARRVCVWLCPCRHIKPWSRSHVKLISARIPRARPVRLAYQPPASSTFLSEQTSHHQPVSSISLSEQTSTSHQPPAERTGC